MASAALTLPSAAFSQVFVSQGPGPTFGPFLLSGSADQPPSGPGQPRNGSIAGALNVVAPDLRDPKTLYVGAVNGGIWATHNGGTTWTPLTDKQASLSISSLALDPTDPTHKTLIAGAGLTAAGSLGTGVPSFFVNSGGLRTGLIVSTDGGNTWTTPAGNATVAGVSIVNVEARGPLILAAGFEPLATAPPNDPVAAKNGALYRSTDGGKTFTVGAPGLPPGPVSSLVGDPSNPAKFYAAVTSTTVPTATSLYVSADSGASWSPAFTSTTSVTGGNVITSATGQVFARVSAGPQGSVAMTVIDVATRQINALYLSLDSGKTWSKLALPSNLNVNAQAGVNAVVAVDPANPRIVYIAGDTSGDASNFTASAYRVQLRPDGSSFFQSLTGDGFTADGSTIHADARFIAFDANGRLILANDGGLYARTSPQTTGGAWTGLNGNLSVWQIYAIAYDANSKRLIVAGQDTGSALQSAPGSALYNSQTPGDGTVAVVNDRTLNQKSAIYSAAQNLFFLNRTIVDAQGNPVGPHPTVLVKFDGPLVNMDNDNVFRAPFVLNRVDPTRMAFASDHVFISQDPLKLDGAQQCTSDRVSQYCITLHLTDLGQIGAGPGVTPVSSLAYGTNDNPGALLAGVFNPPGQRLFLSTAATPAPGTLKALPQYAGMAPLALVFDPRSQARFFVADSADLWSTLNGTAAPAAVTFQNLTPKLPASFSRPSSVEFISNNGVNALLVGGLSTAAARSPITVADSDASGNLANWRSFGQGLPNTQIGALSYNPAVDVLAVGTFGRGAWVLYDVTSYFATATTLKYGLADNDSAPDPFYLTNGEKASRPLEKWGAGTLTLNGTARYTGATTLFGGTTVVNGSIASSSGLTVMPSATVSGGGIVPATTMMGTIAPGLAGNAPTTLTVNGSYTQTSGSAYSALINGMQGDRIAVNGPANIQGGTLVVTAQSSSVFAPRYTYTLLGATNGLSGGFSSASASLSSPFLQPAFTQDGNNVYLTLTINGFLAAAQTPLQAAVGGAIDASVLQATGDYATVLGTLANLSPSQVPSILTSLSGMNYSGFSNSMVQGAQLFMNNFLAQASGANRGKGKVALAEACEVACDASEPAKWGAWGGGLGGVGTVGANQGVGGVTYNLGGFAAGLDRRITDSVLAGITVGYTAGSQWVSGFSGQGFSNTFQVGLYGGYAQGPAYLDGLVGYAYSANQLSRPISIPGLLPRTALGQTGANQVYGQAEGGWRFNLGGPLNSFVTPFARLQAYTGTQNAFTESGAQSLDLTVAAQTTNSLRSVLGTKLAGAVDLGWKEKLAAELRVGWSHEYADTSRPVMASFVGASPFGFTTYGASPQRDGAVVGLDANTAIADATSVYLRYEGYFSGQDSSHALTAGLRMTW